MSRGTSRAPADPGAAALAPLVTEVVEAAGYLLDDLEVKAAGRTRLVRIVVDADVDPGPDDDPVGGVGLDEMADLSRKVSAALDAAEQAKDAPLPAGAYTLEVTTPGTDRPLTLPRHWRRAWLRRAALTLTDGTTLTARVGGVDDPADGPATVTLAVPGESKVKGRVAAPTRRVLRLDEVDRAAVEVEFSPPPDPEIAMLREARTHTGPDTGPDQEETS